MRKGFEKKSQAQIITAILLIIIALVAVVIVWNIVSGLINKESKNIDAELLTVNLDIQSIAIYPTGSSEVKVHRGSDTGDIDGLKFVFYDDKGNSAVEDKKDLLGVLETRTYSFSPFNGVGKIEKVSVFPMKNNNLGRESLSNVKSILEIPEGLVSWYEFDDEKDFTGKNDGSLAGANLDNGELVLDNGYFLVKDSDSLDLKNGLAISIWIKPDNVDSGEIIYKGNNYKLFLSDRKLKFDFSSNGAVYSKESYEDVDNNWNHIAISIDSSGNFKMFVNEETASDFENFNVDSADINDEELKIGNGFSGRIDNVMIFNKALSVEQIKGLYSYGLK